MPGTGCLRVTNVRNIMNIEHSTPALRKMEIYLIKAARPLPCSCCKKVNAEFQTSIWYDYRATHKREPIVEILCRSCLSSQLTAEWGISPAEPDSHLAGSTHQSAVV